MRWILLAALSLGAAYAQDVRYNYDRTANFPQYRTYKWVKIQSQVTPSQLVEQQLMGIVDQEMARRGFVKVDGNADLYVAYQMSVQQQQEVDTWNEGGPWGWGGGWGPGWGAGGLSQSTVHTINVGTLVLDFYDPARKQLVWRGSATKTLNPSKKPEKNYKNMQKAVAKLLKDFPPKPGS